MIRRTIFVRHVKPNFRERLTLSSNKAIVSGISGRYARALFDLANESKALDVVEGDLVKLNSLLDESADVRSLVASPIYGRAEQSAAVAAIAKAIELGDLATKFLGVLATNRRLNILASVIVGYGQFMSKHRGEVTAQVASAHELSSSQLKELEKKLKASVGHDVAIDAVVDENLLGGLVVKVGSLMVDSSLKTKLDNLAIAMKGVG